MLIGETPMALADSRIELNLNEPARLRDTSWIHIGKYVGVWWEMHLNRSTWGAATSTARRTPTCKRYIDFAAKNGFGGVLVEGWNRGWDGDWIANGKTLQLHRVVSGFRSAAALPTYARERGVRLIGHQRDRRRASRTTNASSRRR